MAASSITPRPSSLMVEDRYPAKRGVPRPAVTGLVLAGGQGRRMGGVDKGLQLLDGRSLVEWTLDRLLPQVDEVLISANRNRNAYEQFGPRVLPDEFGGYAGPLAGLHAGFTHAHCELVASVPCDAPFLPADLVARLATPLMDAGVDVSVARTGTRTHPVVCVARRRLLPHLAAFLDAGGRKFDAWYATLNVSEVSFDDCPEAFTNINTPADLESAARLRRT